MPICTTSFEIWASPLFWTEASHPQCGQLETVVCGGVYSTRCTNVLPEMQNEILLLALVTTLPCTLCHATKYALCQAARNTLCQATRNAVCQTTRNTLCQTTRNTIPDCKKHCARLQERMSRLRHSLFLIVSQSDLVEWTSEFVTYAKTACMVRYSNNSPCRYTKKVVPSDVNLALNEACTSLRCKHVGMSTVTSRPRNLQHVCTFSQTETLQDFFRHISLYATRHIAMIQYQVENLQCNGLQLVVCLHLGS